MSDACAAAALYAAGEPQLQLLLYDSCLCMIKPVAQYSHSIAHQLLAHGAKTENEQNKVAPRPS